MKLPRKAKFLLGISFLVISVIMTTYKSSETLAAGKQLASSPSKMRVSWDKATKRLTPHINTQSVPVDSDKFLQGRNLHSNSSKEKHVINILSQKDVLITLKTGRQFHKSRIRLLYLTWLKHILNQTYVVSDVFDEELQSLLGDNFQNTSCGSSHHRSDLCCKMGVEYSLYMKSNKRWFCHFDDDTYVNIDQLLRHLRLYDWRRPWYIGKRSTTQPIRSLNDPMPQPFWFATGGAGVCFSREMARRMESFTSGSRLVTLCERIRLPDDCTLGYISELLVGVKLTEIVEFHSHLENLAAINDGNLKDQITLSYKDDRTVDVSGFTLADDPTRFKSAHCHLYPADALCLNRPQL